VPSIKIEISILPKSIALLRICAETSQWRHPLLLRAGAIALWLLAFSANGDGQVRADAACSVSAFESQPAATVDACTSVLNNAGLSDAPRVEALKIRGRSLHKVGRLDDAIRDYEAALRLSPNDPELHLRRGWTAYDKGDLQLVLDQAEEALRLKPDYANAYDLIGATLARRDVGRTPEAVPAYRQAIRLDPSDPLFRYHLVQALECCGLPEDALQAADALLRLPTASITKPDSVDYYLKTTSFRTAATLERGRLLAVLGRIDDAEKAYDQAVQDDPGALTYAWRGAFLLEHSAPAEPLDKVQADLDRSLAADANFWFSRGLAGRVQFYSKNYVAAAPEFARAVELYPINGEMRWWYAMTLRLLGRIDDASAEAVAAFRVDPGFMFEKAPVLQEFGFVPTLSPDADPRPALYDAARACMLDEHCS
jgi:tetratricopeptide (TPR) repeat protein